jgi:mRNA-degrading endonuclease toxin of MazEF toxin-antitoxin module
MSPGEIHLAMFPFGGSAGGKLRPVLVLTGPLGSVPEFLTAYMSSVIPATVLPTDILLDPAQSEHSGTGLRQVTLLRLNKLATLHGRSLVRHLGRVSAATWADVEKKLRLLLNLP